MNAIDRDEQRAGIELLQQGMAIVTEIGEREEEKYDGLTEGLQNTAANLLLSQNAEKLTEAASEIENAIAEAEELAG